MWQWQVLWYSYNALFCCMLFHMKPSSPSYLPDLAHPQHKPGLLIYGVRYFKIIPKIKFLAMISGAQPHRPSCIETEFACYGWMQAVWNRKDNTDLFIPKAIMGGVWVATEEYRPCAPTGLAFSNPTPANCPSNIDFQAGSSARIFSWQDIISILFRIFSRRDITSTLFRVSTPRMTGSPCKSSSFPMHQTNSHLQR